MHQIKTLKSDKTCKDAINQDRSFWTKTAPDILQERISSQEQHVYAGEIGVILTLGSCLIAVATISKNTSPRLRAQTVADRTGRWERCVQTWKCGEYKCQLAF